MIGESNYTECVVKKQASKAEPFLKGLLVVLEVVLIILALVMKGILSVLGFVLAIAFVCFIMNLWPKFRAEYEYIFVDGQIDFDVMYSGDARKHLKTIDMDKVESVTPVLNYEDIENAKRSKNPDVTICTYISGNKEAKVYQIKTRSEKGMDQIFFEPDANFLSYMKRKSPRKVEGVSLH